MAHEVREAAFERGEILVAELVFREAAVHFERTDGHDEHGRVGLEAAETAFDVEEFFRPQVGAESGLRDRVVGQLEAEARGKQGVAAVGDVRERTAVDQDGRAFERLNQVRLDRLLQQDGGGFRGVEIARGDGLAVDVVRHDHVGDTAFEVGDAGRQAEHGHQLGGRGDLETGLPRVAALPFRPELDVPQGAVVHVQAAFQDHVVRVDAERVAVEDVVVGHGDEQVVRRADRVEIAREMQVDVLHRDDLRPAAAGRAALASEDRAKGRFADRRDDLLSASAERVGQADGRGGLAFARRGRRDRGHEHEASVRLSGKTFKHARFELGFVAPVGGVIGFGKAERGGDLRDRTARNVGCYFEVGFHIGCPCIFGQ